MARPDLRSGGSCSVLTSRPPYGLELEPDCLARVHIAFVGAPVAGDALDDPQAASVKVAGADAICFRHYLLVVVNPNVQPSMVRFDLERDHARAVLDSVGHQLACEESGVLDDVLGHPPAIEESDEKRARSRGRISPIGHLRIGLVRVSIRRSRMHDLRMT